MACSTIAKIVRFPPKTADDGRYGEHRKRRVARKNAMRGTTAGCLPAHSFTVVKSESRSRMGAGLSIYLAMARDACRDGRGPFYCCWDGVGTSDRDSNRRVAAIR